MHNKTINLTDCLHVFIEVFTGDHLPRPNKLINHLCSLCVMLSRRSITVSNHKSSLGCERSTLKGDAEDTWSLDRANHNPRRHSIELGAISAQLNFSWWQGFLVALFFYLCAKLSCSPLWQRWKLASLSLKYQIREGGEKKVDRTQFYLLMFALSHPFWQTRSSKTGCSWSLHEHRDPV